MQSRRIETMDSRKINTEASQQSSKKTSRVP